MTSLQGTEGDALGRAPSEPRGQVGEPLPTSLTSPSAPPSLPWKAPTRFVLQNRPLALRDK